MYYVGVITFYMVGTGVKSITEGATGVYLPPN